MATAIDVELEENRIEFLHRGEKVGDASIDPMIVPAGETRVVPLSLHLGVTAAALSQGLGLLSTEDWAITLYIEVVPEYEFPITLLHTESKSAD